MESNYDIITIIGLYSRRLKVQTFVHILCKTSDNW